MSIFNIISLLGGLAMFLYGMRLMGNGLKESSSGTLKVAMEKATNNVFTAFLLGVLVTAVIQSSTATIVITSGLVAAGIISLRQSLGIIIGANVGTTVTGQIIRLLDIDSASTAWLEFFKPSTLAPLALILGIVLIMFCKFRRSEQVGSIAIGFGVLFTGLLNMTSAVNALSTSDAFTTIFMNLEKSPVIGYFSGAAVAFALQSSSATIGILQSFAMTGIFTFKGIYAVIVGVYLGDCVTTAIVCSIGAKPDARRVGIVNILFNLSETVVVLTAVTILHLCGALDGIWNMTMTPGTIANTNTIFNLGCALLLMPAVPLYEKLSHIIIKDEAARRNKYQEKLEALDPKFYETPAIAFSSSYEALLVMFDAARANIEKAFSLFDTYDEKVFNEIQEEEENIDLLADRVSNYMVSMSPSIKQDEHTRILTQYYKMISEFERLGDHAVNISEGARGLYEGESHFSEVAMRELHVLEDLIGQILNFTRQAFAKRDIEAAREIEPYEEVVDDMVSTLRDNHLARLSRGECNVVDDNAFLNLMSDVERISDVCSNVGLAIIARVDRNEVESHAYVAALHHGENEQFNATFEKVHAAYFGKLKTLS